MLTAFTDVGLAGYAVALVLLGLGLALWFSRVRTALLGTTLVLSLLHASWIGPWFVAAPAPPAPGPTIRILSANLYFGRADARTVVEAARAADVLVLTEITVSARERQRALGIGRDFGYEAAARPVDVGGRPPAAAGGAEPAERSGHRRRRLQRRSQPLADAAAACRRWWPSTTCCSAPS